LHLIFSSLSLCKKWLIQWLYKKLPQWTFLCREPSIKKRIWKNLGGLQPPSESAYEQAISKCLAIYETAVICKSIVWFLVFCARRTNEGGNAGSGLVDASSTLWAGKLSQTSKALCLKLNVVFIYFYTQIFFLNQFRKTIFNIWFRFQCTGDQPVEWSHRTHRSIYNTAQQNQRELQLMRSENEWKLPTSSTDWWHNNDHYASLTIHIL